MFKSTDLFRKGKKERSGRKVEGKGKKKNGGGGKEEEMMLKT